MRWAWLTWPSKNFFRGDFVGELSLTVRQLNTYVRSLLEGDAHLADLTLMGEISNFKNHFASGHCYFVLKDHEAAIKVVMFRANASRLSFQPKDGIKVACRGYVSIYEKDGTFQFYAQAMQPLSPGDIAAEFERIRRKLEAEGLFDPAHKRPLKEYPSSIGVITSDVGAALQDILKILARRFPCCAVTVYPALVQGAAAPQSLMQALEKAYLQPHDLLIIGRGGGSAEDLSCFNDEALARKLYAAPMPVISAVGHETDFTICDFVCDLRAPTPSAAAELAVPDQVELLARFSMLQTALTNRYALLLANFERCLQHLTASRVFTAPQMLYNPFEQRLAAAGEALDSRYRALLLRYAAKLNGQCRALAGLSPLETLKRGFAVAFQDKKHVSAVKELKPGNKLTLRFSDGLAQCAVEQIQSEVE